MYINVNTVLIFTGRVVITQGSLIGERYVRNVDTSKPSSAARATLNPIYLEYNSLCSRLPTDGVTLLVYLKGCSDKKLKVSLGGGPVLQGISRVTCSESRTRKAAGWWSGGGSW